LSLRGKNIIIGITGGIAAYKIPFLVRILKKSGANVKVIMTPAARDFVSPVTLSVLSGNAVLSEFVKTGNEGVWNNHVALADWADLMVFAPVTANTLAKMASGQADNLLMAVYLSAKSPVMIAPAMDLDMYAHPATRQNIEKLKNFGYHIIPATEGELASGLTGYGRMEEPEKIAEIINNHFKKKQNLTGKTVLVTAGPTYEAIDPVRFIGNHSSGKMGIAIAEEAAQRGAKVILVLGPTHLSVSHPDIKVHKITSAQEMYNTVHSYFDRADITVMAAAVADFTPEKKSTEKIKKSGNKLQLSLQSTQDILASLGEKKSEKQILIGFAMETQNEKENAIKKLKKKNLDFIVLNSLREKNAGFKHDTNKVSILTRNGEILDFPLKSKKEVAADIFDLIEKLV
jgi:phosphopantothenoylcysteine decarboxylase/phosphopantothenate--cysteine ligase